MQQYILGMGCDRGTSIETLNTAVSFALSETKITLSNIKAIATIDKKSDEAGLLALSKKHNWLMLFFSASQLASVEVPNPSEVVMKYMGTPAVSEAAAMLAANTGVEDLVLEKFKFRGADNKNATVSIARVKN